MTRIAVISVLFRGGDSVSRWVAALERARADVGHRAHVSVIAVDNASGDGTAERVRTAAPWITVLALPFNAGFAAGCNAGLSLVSGDAIVVLLNPDVAVSPEFFARISELEWDGQLAAVGPQIQTPDGDLEQSARAFPSVATAFFGRTTLLSRLLPESRMAQSQLRSTRGAQLRVDWVSGACLIAPAERFRRIGPLDEGYWMYWEDADWCRRAYANRLRVEYRSDIVVVHHQGSSSRARPFRTVAAFHRSAARYYRRHVARNRVEALAAGVALALRATLKLSITALRRVGTRSEQRGDGVA